MTTVSSLGKRSMTAYLEGEEDTYVPKKGCLMYGPLTTIRNGFMMNELPSVAWVIAWVKSQRLLTNLTWTPGTGLLQPTYINGVTENLFIDFPALLPNVVTNITYSGGTMTVTNLGGTSTTVGGFSTGGGGSGGDDYSLIQAQCTYNNGTLTLAQVTGGTVTIPGFTTGGTWTGPTLVGPVTFNLPSSPGSGPNVTLYGPILINHPTGSPGLTINADMYVVGPVSVTGDTTFTGTVNVTGGTTINGEVSITGGDLNVAGPYNINIGGYVVCPETSFTDNTYLVNKYYVVQTFFPYTGGTITGPTIINYPTGSPGLTINADVNIYGPTYYGGAVSNYDSTNYNYNVYADYHLINKRYLREFLVTDSDARKYVRQIDFDANTAELKYQSESSQPGWFIVPGFENMQHYIRSAHNNDGTINVTSEQLLGGPLKTTVTQFFGRFNLVSRAYVDDTVIDRGQMLSTGILQLGRQSTLFNATTNMEYLSTNTGPTLSVDGFNDWLWTRGSTLFLAKGGGVMTGPIQTTVASFAVNELVTLGKVQNVLTAYLPLAGGSLTGRVTDTVSTSVGFGANDLIPKRLLTAEGNSIRALFGAYVSKTGDTMTGPIAFNYPNANFQSHHLVNKSYVDASTGGCVQKSGDTMTGGLIVSTGGITTTTLSLAGHATTTQTNFTANNQLVTKKYVDDQNVDYTIVRHTNTQQGTRYDPTAGTLYIYQNQGLETNGIAQPVVYAVTGFPTTTGLATESWVTGQISNLPAGPDYGIMNTSAYSHTVTGNGALYQGPGTTPTTVTHKLTLRQGHNSWVGTVIDVPSFLLTTQGHMTGPLTTERPHTLFTTYEFVTKEYVASATDPYLLKAGGALTGAVTTSRTTFTNNQEVVTKKYVDDAIDAIPAPVFPNPIVGDLHVTGKVTVGQGGYTGGNQDLLTVGRFINDLTSIHLINGGVYNLGSGTLTLYKGTNATQTTVTITGFGRLETMINLNAGEVINGGSVTNGQLTLTKTGGGTVQPINLNLDSTAYLPLTGGAVSGPISTNQTSFDANHLISRAYIDPHLTFLFAALSQCLQKTGGALTGAVLQNKTGATFASNELVTWQEAFNLSRECLLLTGGALTGAVTTTQTQFASNELVTRSYVLARSGDSVTGPITTNQTTFAANALITRDYVTGLFMPKQGGQFTGPVSTTQTAFATNEFVSKSYVDARPSLPTGSAALYSSNGAQIHTGEMLYWDNHQQAYRLTPHATMSYQHGNTGGWVVFPKGVEIGSDSTGEVIINTRSTYDSPSVNVTTWVEGYVNQPQGATLTSFNTQRNQFAYNGLGNYVCYTSLEARVGVNTYGVEYGYDVHWARQNGTMKRMLTVGRETSTHYAIELHDDTAVTGILSTTGSIYSGSSVIATQLGSTSGAGNTPGQVWLDRQDATTESSICGVIMFHNSNDPQAVGGTSSREEYGAVRCKRTKWGTGVEHGTVILSAMQGGTLTDIIKVGKDAATDPDDVVVQGNIASTGQVKANTLNLTNLPTSEVGLSSGDVWRDGTYLRIVL